jgi:hypothetical protein
MEALYYVCAHVSSDHSFSWMSYYTCQRNMDTTYSVYVDVSWEHALLRMIYYTSQE